MATPSDDAILVVSRRIKPGQEHTYEDWLRRVIQAARAFPGYMGVTTLSPEGVDSDLRYLIWRFDNAATLEAWEKSDVRNELVAEVQNYSTQHYEKATGMETWFSLPGMKKVQAPPKWKMFTVTLFAAYLVSLHGPSHPGLLCGFLTPLREQPPLHCHPCRHSDVLRDAEAQLAAA